MGNILENNKSFCLAPWIHSYISPQGLRQICCVAEHNFGKNVPLEDMWNSDEMKNIRKRMLEGETLSECNRCNDSSINPYSYRKYFNTEYITKIDEAILNTDIDGNFNGLPKTFDYRTNVCNFKCKMCTEEFSTQIQGEKINNGLNLQFNILNTEEKEKSLEIINNEFSNDEILKNVLEIYWAGGEPMYWKTHWETLDRLIEKGYAKNVTLRYHSNLSTIEYKEKLLTDYFEHFKDIQFYSSLDGTGNIGEWIRSNLNFEKWKINFSKLIQYRNTHSNIKIKLSIAVTTATLFDFENLYELCKEFDVEPDFQTCYATNATNLLSPKSFPKEYIKNICFKFLDVHINDNDYIIIKFRNYVDFLLKETFFEKDFDYKSNIKYGLTQINYLELNRPHSNITFEDILKYDSKIYNFYKNIK
jgi:organic radical activating enzyme